MIIKKHYVVIGIIFLLSLLFFASFFWYSNNKIIGSKEEVFQSPTYISEKSNSYMFANNPSFLTKNFTSYNNDGYDFVINDSRYNFYVKNNSNFGDGVKYCGKYNTSEYCVIYQSQDMSYRDSTGSQDYLGSISNVLGVVNNSSIYFTNVFNITDLQYINVERQIKENYILKQKPRIPANYLGSNITLDYGGYIKHQGLDIYVDGVNRTGQNFKTNSLVELRFNNTLLFYLPEPYAFDNNGSIIRLEYEIKDNAGQLWFYVRTPYSWLNDSSRVYPIKIDPSYTFIAGIETSASTADYFGIKVYVKENVTLLRVYTGTIATPATKIVIKNETFFNLVNSTINTSSFEANFSYPLEQGKYYYITSYKDGATYNFLHNEPSAVFPYVGTKVNVVNGSQGTSDINNGVYNIMGFLVEENVSTKSIQILKNDSFEDNPFSGYNNILYTINNTISYDGLNSTNCAAVSSEVCSLSLSTPVDTSLSQEISLAFKQYGSIGLNTLRIYFNNSTGSWKEVSGSIRKRCGTLCWEDVGVTNNSTEFRHNNFNFMINRTFGTQSKMDLLNLTIERNDNEQVSIIQPTSSSPIIVSTGNKLPINFTLSSVTQGLSTPNVTINGTLATITNTTQSSLSFPRVSTYYNYTFNDTSSNSASWASPAGSNRFIATTLATPAQYTNMSSYNSQYAWAKSDASNDEIFWRMNFTINETISNIHWLNLSFSGYENATEAGTLYVFNWTSNAWVTMGTIGAGTNTWISVNYTGNSISHLINSSNKRVVMVAEGANFDLADGDSVFVDYVTAIVGTNTTQTSYTYPLEFDYLTSQGYWQVNVTIPSNTTGCPVDLFLNTTYSGTTYNGTEVGAIDYNGVCSDTTKPTYSSNATNSTYVSETANFSITITDETALHPNGYYIFSTNNTGVWANDSLVNFTTTPTRVNVTKVLNDTVGISVGFRWYFSDNVNNTQNTTVFNLITTTPVTDTCTYTSGTWNVDCADNCVINGDVNLLGNDILLTGTGLFKVDGGSIRNYNRFFIKGTDAANICRVQLLNGGKIID